MKANWIINEDGSIYHLKLHREQVAETIITVGDPERVEKISQRFDQIEFKQQSREFVTHTGRIGSKKITVISTGIGTDNIDIVLNELDALFNIDLHNGVRKNELTNLNFIRIGTSGSIQKEIPVDTLLLSKLAIGLDGLMRYYKNSEADFQSLHPALYGASLDHCSTKLYQQFKHYNFVDGHTLTAAGFYAPQGRQTRIDVVYPNLLVELSELNFPFGKITNLEMETAGIYGLSSLMGHHAISLNAILANRASNTFSSNPEQTINKLIDQVFTMF